MKIVHWQMLGVIVAVQVKIHKDKSQQRAGTIILSIREIGLIA
jgi:hypothetical protein